MKKRNLLILTILSVFVISSCNNSTEVTNENKSDSTNIVNKATEQLSETDIKYSGRIAYIAVDSLLPNYKLYKTLEKKLKAKWDASEREFNRKRNALEKDVMAFKQKEANNGFLSQESYMAQGQELMMREQKLQELNARLTQDIAEEEARLNQQIKDSVDAFVEEFNKTANYDFILNKAFILYGRKGFDITDTVMVLLNERYDKSQVKTEEK